MFSSTYGVCQLLVDSPGSVAWYSRLLTCRATSVGEAAKARPDHPRLELELEHEPGGRPRERQRGLGALRNGDVALSAELERLEIDGVGVAELLSGAELDDGR